MAKYKGTDFKVGQRVLVDGDEPGYWGKVVQVNPRTVEVEYDDADSIFRVFFSDVVMIKPEDASDQTAPDGYQADPDKLNDTLKPKHPTGPRKSGVAALVNKEGLLAVLGTVVLAPDGANQTYSFPNNRLWVITTDTGTVVEIAPINGDPDDDYQKVIWTCYRNELRTVSVATTIPMEYLP